MTKRETASSINQAAAEWVARVDRAGADSETETKLAEWLAGDDRRRGAYFRASSVWSMLDRASAMGAGRPQNSQGLVDPDNSQWPSLTRRKMIWGGGAVAASIAIAIAGPTLWQEVSPQSGSISIATAIGEQRRVPLADGSLAEINTDSKIAVRLEAHKREVVIDQGEAYFQVAHNRDRPFIVIAGQVRVQAVGTAFSVRRTADGAEVQVTEGKVEVWNVDSGESRRLIAAGSRAIVSETQGVADVARDSDDIDRKLAWRQGQIIFEGDTLVEAAAEFNRYNRTQIHVTGSVLGSQRLVGRFRTNEPVAFARSAAAMLGANIAQSSDSIILSYN